jgi:uncharacterized OB-fold protein
MNATDIKPPARPMPELDKDTAFFWTSGADGRLRIARCQACEHYIHPPVPYCAACGSDRVEPAPVSGRGRIASFTVNEQRWLPGLELPYVIAAVELDEQRELYVFSNVVGCPAESVEIGMPVAVTFERHGDIYLPMFQPAENRDA